MKKELKEVIVKGELMNSEIRVEPLADGTCDILQGDDMIMMTSEQTLQLHAALSEMLNQWRPISEPPNTSRKVWVTDGHKVEVTIYLIKKWDNVFIDITHWKEITKPVPPKN